jgi:anthranilate phosphoribosyltransferase
MITAFILAITKNGREKDVLAELNKLSEITEAWNVYGDYDVLARVEAMDLDSLNEFMLRKVRAISHISMTSTMIGL